MTVEQSNLPWLVYMIRASDDRLYTGITNNLPKRWHAHCHTKQGAKFFRGRHPEQVVYIEQQHDRAGASRREYQLKQLTRQQKQTLVTEQSNKDWHNIFKLAPTASAATVT